MLDKRYESASVALSDVRSGSVVLISGFGDAGVPTALLAGLADRGVGDLTVVSNNAGYGEDGLAALLRNGQVRKLVCSFPRSRGSVWFERRYFAQELELELVPQGTLSERIRAGGAGIAAFYTRTGVGTAFAEGKEVRVFGADSWLLEEAIVADVALVKADRADELGNATYRMTARNFGPTMAAAARVSVLEVREVVTRGCLTPEEIVTPGIYVDRLVVHGA